jgi:rhodanese-related sulfurtransferase
MASDQLYAVFDVRERGEFNECQIPHATSLPRSQIEFRVAGLVPDRNIPVIVYDEGGVRAPLAARTLLALGYVQVSILDGGLGSWQTEGRPVASGVNVPSKAFGEKVYHEQNVPDLAPQELKALQESTKKLMILDVRTPEEYSRFCIPGGINVPGGDLILWAEMLKQQENTAVVVNCAGRTRSIIGAAALHRLGLTNVRALRNGTMGWVLAGLELENKPRRSAPPQPPQTSREKATALARQVAEEEQIPSTSSRDLARLIGFTGGMRYLIDVRSEDEYVASHVPGSFNLPGGQAVQRADDFIAVRNAPIIFISNESARAVMAAYWYRQMGFADVSVLEGGLSAWSKSVGGLETGELRDEPLGYQAAKQVARFVDSPTLERMRRDLTTLILDVGTSVEFEAAHVPGARWISRGWIEKKLSEQFTDRKQAIVLTCPDGRQSLFGARTLVEMGYTDVSVLDGGVRAWAATGFPIEQGSNDCLAPANDVVLSPSIRGTKEDMQRYLDWELKLNR